MTPVFQGFRLIKDKSEYETFLVSAYGYTYKTVRKCFSILPQPKEYPCFAKHYVADDPYPDVGPGLPEHVHLFIYNADLLDMQQQLFSVMD